MTAGSTHSSTRGLRPPEQLERPAGFPSSQRRQPIRLHRPWDSPGKNTGEGCHFLLLCMKVKNESEVAQSCQTVCDPMGCSLPGSSVHGILQARVLEWIAISSSRGCFQPTPRGTPACRGTFGGRRKAVRDRFTIQGGTVDFP